MILRFLLLVLVLCSAPASAQQNVRVPVTDARGTVQLMAQLYRPQTQGEDKLPAVAIFHGCGGVGINNARMAGLLRDWGYAALVVDSFTVRHMTDVCGRHWPTQADAETRVRDIDAALVWLAKQPFVDPERMAFMGYSYGGGVALLRAFRPAAPKAAAAVVGRPIATLPAMPAPATLTSARAISPYTRCPWMARPRRRTTGAAR